MEDADCSECSLRRLQNAICGMHPANMHSSTDMPRHDIRSGQLPLKEAVTYTVTKMENPKEKAMMSVVTLSTLQDPK